MKRYRIVEERYENVSHFYPQYKDENTAYYILGRDKNGKEIKSEYEYFGSWKEHAPGASHWAKDVFYDMSMARHRIEMDIQQNKGKELLETIIHEY
jgi:hypothetical protein